MFENTRVNIWTKLAKPKAYLLAYGLAQTKRLAEGSNYKLIQSSPCHSEIWRPERSYKLVVGKKIEKIYVYSRVWCDYKHAQGE